jgi:hypothetical protein
MEIKTIQPKKEGQKPLKFRVGGLHKSTHTPMGQHISSAKKAAALAGKYGEVAKKQALFAKNVLTGGRK